MAMPPWNFSLDQSELAWRIGAKEVQRETHGGSPRDRGSLKKKQIDVKMWRGCERMDDSVASS